MRVLYKERQTERKEFYKLIGTLCKTWRKHVKKTAIELANQFDTPNQEFYDFEKGGNDSMRILLFYNEAGFPIDCIPTYKDFLDFYYEGSMYALFGMCKCKLLAMLERED